MTQNILNIDDLASEPAKVVVVDGNRHEMAEITVQSYIDRVKRTKSIPTDAGIDVQIEETVNLLAETFPTLSVERMRRMPLLHLDQLLAFTLQAPEDIAKAVESDPAAVSSAEGNVPS